MLAPVLLLVRLYHALGVGGLVLGVILVAAATLVDLRVRRAVVCRRSGGCTPTEPARLDDQDMAVATARMPRRDGWNVVDLSRRKGQPRL
ncbi:hypothetical protein [Streptomyces sp. AF1A]|uniref:hypothetical protein n=1 Tax=Streptomyces sp. AF1A TaxID=3394350 RepID=UPI0039BCD399